MNAYIISIGDELLNGDIVNTNASWIAQHLSELGFDIVSVETVGDDRFQLYNVLDRSTETADLIVMTGGLGPTHDDITKKVLAEFVDSPMVMHKETLEHVKKIFERLDLPFSSSNELQAQVPNKAEVLFNSQGTAPGMWLPWKSSVIVSLPGVPHEMKHLMRTAVLPRIQKTFDHTVFAAHRYLQTAGIGESTLSDLVLADIIEKLKSHERIAFLPHHGTITLRLSGSSKHSMSQADEHVEELAKRVRSAAGEHIYAEGKNVSLARAIGDRLNIRGKKLAVAESCTGGMLASEITSVPGCSSYFTGGIVAYANEIKEHELNVSQNTLQTHGAVSAETAMEMARGIRKKFGVDFALSTTGIAGPSGGTEEKPVGTVWFGFSSEYDCFAVKTVLTKDRTMNQVRSVNIAFDILRRKLDDIKNLPYNLSPIR